MDGIDPDFLLEAEKLLEEGNPREAAELCTRGLVKYPEYNTAYILLLRALDNMGDKVQMEEVFESAPQKVQNSPIVTQLIGSISNKKEPSEENEEKNSKESKLEEEINQAIRNDELSPNLIANLTKEGQYKADVNISETLTLAKIYERQDAYAEALAIYKQLQSVSDDDNAYADKILELETLLEEE